jgi:hypothetical protein
MSERKYMTVKEFVDSGMLFEVNRRVLHPLGVAIEVIREEDGTVQFGGIWDMRDDPEGIVFEEYTFWRGMKKWCSFLAQVGQRAMLRRQGVVGFVRQTETPFKEGDVLVLWNPEFPSLPQKMRVMEYELGGTEYKVLDLEAEPVKTRVKGKVVTHEPVGVLAAGIVHRNYVLEMDNG